MNEVFSMVQVYFREGGDLAMASDLLKAVADEQKGVLVEDLKVIGTPGFEPDLTIWTFDFPTMYMACWFVAKCASFDFIWWINFRADGPAKMWYRAEHQETVKEA